MLVPRFLAACGVSRLVALDRNTLRHRSRRSDDQLLWARMREIAETTLQRQVSRCVFDEHWFLTFQEAQVVIEAWRRDYHKERTHSTIGDMTPMEFIQHHQDRSQAAQESTSLALV
ncbi:MAG: transposase [Nitrospirales bacterium]|nr:transposase [Nitrospirales bacterium]